MATVWQATLKPQQAASAGMTALLGLAIAAALAWCFKTGILSLLAAWQRPEYSHGYLIPAIALFIALIRSRGVSETPFAGTRILPGALVVALGVAVGALGTLASIPDIVTYGLVVAIGGVIIGVSGIAGLRQLWPAWAYLLFMLPLPNFIYWPLSIKLQFLSSEIGVWIIQFLGIPVFLEGNIIDLGVYKLQVAEACSGLRYLFPLMSFGFLFAILYVGNWWQKLILFLSTIPITIGMNSLRIAVIGVLVNSYGIEQAEGFLHFFEGWVVFIFCILLLYGEALLLRKMSGSWKSGESIFGLGFDGIGRDLRRWSEMRAGKPVMAIAAVLLVASLVWPFVTDRPSTIPERKPFDEFPITLGGWSGKTVRLEADIERVLAADDYFFADYSSSQEKAPVNLLVSYYQSQTSGSGIHSPEVCIPAGGWEVSRWEQSHLALGDAAIGDFAVNRAVIQKGQYRQLVYYWFEQRGRRLTSDYAAKGWTVWDSVSSGRSDGALVRVVTSIDGSDVAAAEKRLKSFLLLTLPELSSYVPK